MPEHTHTEVLKKILRALPGEAFIVPGGNAMVLLDPSRDEVIILAALDGENFNDKTKKEINDTIVNALKK